MVRRSDFKRRRDYFGAGADVVVVDEVVVDGGVGPYRGVAGVVVVLLVVEVSGVTPGAPVAPAAPVAPDSPGAPVTPGAPAGPGTGTVSVVVVSVVFSLVQPERAVTARAAAVRAAMGNLNVMGTLQ